MSAKIDFGCGFSAKAAYSRMSQYVHLLSLRRSPFRSTSPSDHEDIPVTVTNIQRLYYDGLRMEFRGRLLKQMTMCWNTKTAFPSWQIRTSGRTKSRWEKDEPSAWNYSSRRRWQDHRLARIHAGKERPDLPERHDQQRHAIRTGDRRHNVSLWPTTSFPKKSI